MIEKDVKALEEKANRGDSAAETELGEMYLKGDKVTQNIQKAKEFLTRAADKGYAKAQELLRELSAKAVEMGKDAKQNFEKAKKEAENAYEQGSENAKNLLDKIKKSLDDNQ